jgi:hypothetical protein
MSSARTSTRDILPIVSLVNMRRIDPAQIASRHSAGPSTQRAVQATSTGRFSRVGTRDLHAIFNVMLHPATRRLEQEPGTSLRFVNPDFDLAVKYHATVSSSGTG